MILDFNIDDLLQQPVVISFISQELPGRILPISKSAYAFLQGSSGLESRIHQEPNIQFRKRMLDKGSNVVRKGSKGCITTLSCQQMLEDIRALIRTLKPCIKTSNRTFCILSHSGAVS